MDEYVLDFARESPSLLRNDVDSPDRQDEEELCGDGRCVTDGSRGLRSGLWRPFASCGMRVAALPGPEYHHTVSFQDTRVCPRRRPFRQQYAAATMT